MKLTAKIFDSKYKHKNHYVYDSDVLKNAVKEFNDSPNKYVLRENKNYVNQINLIDVIGIVNNIYYTNGEIHANIEILDTPEGKIYQELIKNNSVRFSPAGFGEITDNKVTNYTIRSIDAILNHDEKDII